MQRPHRLMVGMLALGLFVNGCYGPFYLVRKVHKFNGEVSDNKWIVEVVYLVATWLPVYGIAGLADAIIFNSIEFWTGKNPMANANVRGISPTKRIVRGDTESVFKRVSTPDGDQLVIEQYQHGRPAASLRLIRQGGAMVALNNGGAVLFSAHALPDGGVTITDANGKTVASYSGDQAQQLLASLPKS